MTLKQHCVHFVLCPKQGTKIEGVVLNRVCILRTFCPKQGQGFKLSAAHLYPNIGRVPHLHPGMQGSSWGIKLRGSDSAENCWLTLFFAKHWLSFS